MHFDMIQKTNEQPIISIIVPVYNAEYYLHRCMDSILSQTFSNYEIILIDDGSTDGSGKICDEYAAADSRIIVIHQRNQGQSVARNSGIQRANGEWIHFVDSDDVIHPQMLELLYKAVKETSANMAVCRRVEDESVPDSFFEQKNTSVEVLTNEETTFLDFLEEGQYYWTIWAKLIKKSIVLQNLFAPGKYYEDNAVVCKWIYDACRIAVVPETLYFYQMNPEGTTKGKISMKYFDFLWAMEEQISFYDSIGYVKMCERALALYFGSYEDRMDKTVYFEDKKKIEHQITKDAITIWKKYRNKYPAIQKEWKHIFFVCCPFSLRLAQSIKSGMR